MRSNVLVVYHFFAHYRAAIMQKLLENKTHNFILAGDNIDPLESGIKPWQPENTSQFVHTQSQFIKKRYLWQSGLIKMAMSKDNDVIIYLGDTRFVSTWLSALVARIMGKRVLFWTIGWLRPETGVKDYIRCSFYRISHGLLLYGNYAKNMAIQKGFKAENIYVIYNSLNYDLQKTIRESITFEALSKVRRDLFGSSERPLVVCSSRLSAHRRLDWLLEAMIHLKNDGHEVNLLLVGEGPAKSQLELKARSSGLSVCFFGECYEEEMIAKLIMAADLTVAPGMVGLTAMQSLAYGTPVITHDNPDKQAPESEAIIPGVNGDFFCYGDSKDLARVIKIWTSRMTDTNFDRKKCYEIIEKFYNPDYQSKVIELAVSGELPNQ
jgi:glycosyltransferase involved in cell wall biosynthesis